MLLLLACAPNGPADGVTAPRSDDHPSSTMADTSAQYFRTFDRFTLQGLDPLDAPPTSAAHVSLVRSGSGRLVVGLHSGDGTTIELAYERRGERWVAERRSHFRDDPLPWLRSLRVVDEQHVEHRYVYFYAEDPAAAGAVPVLAEYSRAEPHERKVWKFPLYPDESDRGLVNEVIDASGRDLMPAALLDKAIERIVSHDHIEGERLVRVEEHLMLGTTKPPEQWTRRFDLRRYPAAFVDFEHFGEVMEVDPLSKG